MHSITHACTRVHACTQAVQGLCRLLLVYGQPAVDAALVAVPLGSSEVAGGAVEEIVEEVAARLRKTRLDANEGTEAEGEFGGTDEAPISIARNAPAAPSVGSVVMLLLSESETVLEAVLNR
jgi:hypothetical protein